MTNTIPHPLPTPVDSAVADARPLASDSFGSAPLLQACHSERPDRRPVWFMRQAGRSLPEYREARRGIAMLDACLRPELVAELTVQPVRRHDVDAGILFSDIVVPLKLAGVGVDIVAGVGPVVAEPVRTLADVRRLPELDPDALTPIAEAVRLSIAALGGVPLIGFAGAPFTLASYLVEGGPSREHLRTKALMLGEPDTWAELASWVARTTSAFLKAQVRAGVSVVQLFDSWAGSLSPEQYGRQVQPHSAAVLRSIAELGVPRIHFGVGTAELLVAMRDAGATVVGVDHRISLREANTRLGGSVPLQGNIDPAALFAGESALQRHVLEVLESGAGAPAHIVNLGHGVPPDTDPDVLTRLVDFIHRQPHDAELPTDSSRVPD